MNVSPSPTCSCLLAAFLAAVGAAQIAQPAPFVALAVRDQLHFVWLVRAIGGL